MKILLVNPKGKISANTALQKYLSDTIKENILWEVYTGFGLSLLVIASLTPRDIELDLIDEKKEQIDFQKKYDLVAISAMTQQAQRAYEIAQKFKKSNTKTIIGGIHPTVCSDEALKYCDSVVVGEVENQWGNIIRDLKSNRLKRKYSDNSVVDLEKSPVPRYDLIKKYNYKVVWVQASRGCPNNCDFCVATNIYGKTYRKKSVNKVVKEIRQIKKIFKYPQISFADDNLFVDKKYGKMLAQALAKENIRWFAQTDISVANDKELLKLLRASGCKILFVGFESLSDEVMANYGFKNKYHHRYSELIENIQKEGIGVFGAFIVGFKNDNTGTVDEIVDFCRQNHLYSAQITILTPYPGSKIWEDFKKENMLIDRTWDYYNGINCNFKHQNFSPDSIETALLDGYKKLYSEDNLRENIIYFKKAYEKFYVK